MTLHEPVTASAPARVSREPISIERIGRSLGPAAFALVAGFLIGSGRWDVLFRSARGLFSALGAAAAHHAAESLRR